MHARPEFSVSVSQCISMDSAPSYQGYRAMVKKLLYIPVEVFHRPTVNCSTVGIDQGDCGLPTADMSFSSSFNSNVSQRYQDLFPQDAEV